MTKEDREFAGQLKRFIGTQKALLATKELDEKHTEQEIDAKREEIKVRKAFLSVSHAELRAERKILARVTKQLAELQGNEAK